ncbi:CoaE-domain-containing protein [Mycena kentingensis (nom. inval.)]|nr:CoaE-domain-containing protein [Mycena kentingensis (nom. inval.)]
MLVVGLTGGIATGKSSVSNILRAKHVPIIDADVLARQVVEPGTPALAKIVAYFGPEILLPDGSLDRQKLGSIIFADETKRKKLNSIVHPAVRRTMLWGIFKNWLSGSKYCVLDVPLLIEGGLWKLCGKVVVVFCSPEVQLERLMKRDNSSREDASARLNSQFSITDKVLYADHVVDNSGPQEELERRVDELLSVLERDVGWTWRLSWLFPPYGMVSAMLSFARRARRTNENPKHFPRDLVLMADPGPDIHPTMAESHEDSDDVHESVPESYEPCYPSISKLLEMTPTDPKRQVPAQPAIGGSVSSPLGGPIQEKP